MYEVLGMVRLPSHISSDSKNDALHTQTDWFWQNAFIMQWLSYIHGIPIAIKNKQFKYMKITMKLLYWWDHYFRVELGKS